MEPRSRRPRPLRPSNYDKIFDPTPNRIFVFGSSLAGIHATGSERYAYNWCGAEWEKGLGLMGSCYAIPTRGLRLQTLKLEEIKKYVDDFILFAWEQRDFEFFIARLGCGPREYPPTDIAPLFCEAPPNCELPAGWEKYSEDPQ